MGRRARARSHRLARAAATIAVTALGITSFPNSPALASPTPVPDGKPSPGSSTLLLTNAPTLAARPPGTPHTAPDQAGTSATVTHAAAAKATQKADTTADPQAAIRAAQAAASAQAKSSGAAVDVPAMTTERSTTQANPDGSFTSTTTFIPQRAQVNGAWAPIDTTLAQNADGSWSPKATVAGINLSAGGTGPLASVRFGTKTITMSWPLGALPAPQISGNHATYSQVLPGVDLRVSADPEGIREVLIVASHTAAANPGLTSLALSLGTIGVNLSQSDGGLTATDTATGHTVFTSPAPVMWDSSAGGASAPSSAPNTPSPVPDPADSPGLGSQVATMPVHLQGNTVTITPSQSMIGDAHTTYPLYIDPPVTIGTYHYAEIYSNAGQTGTAYFDSGVSRSPNGPIVRAGYDSANGGGYVRGMFSFDVGDAMMGQENAQATPTGGGLPEDGSDITGAQMVLTSNSNPCNNGANISVDVDGVNRMDPSGPPTWNQDGPSGTGHTDAGTYYAPVWATTTKLYSANPSACSSGPGNTINIQDNIGGPLTTMVTNVWRNWSGHNGDQWCPCNGDGTATFGMKWTTEAASGTYGSWEVGNASIPAKLIITYRPAPVINQTPTVTPGDTGTAISSNCGQDSTMPTSGPGTYISKNISNAVTLGASFYDIDGGSQIQTQYEFVDVSPGNGSAQYFPGPGVGNFYPALNSAQGGQVQFPAQTITTASGGLAEGHTYKFYPRAVDTFDSTWLDSSIYGFSTSCRFTIAFQPPSPPTLAANGAPDFPALGSGTAPATQMVAAEGDQAGITVQDSTAGVAIDHFDYVFNGDSSKLPQNAPGCSTSNNGCLPAGANTATGAAPNTGLAGFSASANIPVPAGVTTMGDNSLWVQAVDVAGNRSGVFQYQFYLPGNPNAKPILGDVTGNGYPSIVVAAPDPANPTVQHLVAFPGNADPDVTTNVNNGVEVAPASAAPDGNSWVNTLITHRGAERGMPVDDLFAYSNTTHALYYYLNSAVFGSPVPKDAFTGGTAGGGAHRIVVTRPTCVPMPANYNCAGYAHDWSNVTQILALGNAAGGAPGTFAGRTNLITVESDGDHRAHVWMFSPSTGGQVSNPVLLSYDTSQFNWADADLIAPGPTTPSGLPDLWVRDRVSGNLYQFLNRRNAAGVEDPTSLGDKTNATTIGAKGAYQYSTYPVLISAGNPTTTGAQTYTYPALWSVTEPGGQLKLMQGTVNGPAIDTSAQATSWPSSTTSWTNATGATNVNGGTPTNATGPIQLGVDTVSGTNMCMDLHFGDPTPGNFVQTYTCNGTPAQMWTIVDDGTIRWGSGSTAVCLTVSTSPAPAQNGLPSTAGNNGTNAGFWVHSPVVIEACPTAGAAPSGTQVWAFRRSNNAPQAGNGNNWYTVYNPASGLDLDNYGCNASGGVQLDVYWAQDGQCGWFKAPAAEGMWLQAMGSGLASVTKEPASPSASVTTGQSTPNGVDYTLAATAVNNHYGVDWYIPYAGTYAIWADMATGPANGQVELTVDQAAGNGPLPISYDAYTPTAGWNHFAFGDVTLTAGMHTFTFTVTGKNSASSGYSVGLDTLFAGPDHGTGPHAELATSGGTAALPVAAPAAITLDASQSWPGASTLATNAYAFDFGDGTTAAAGPSATATHTYTAAGVYTASVTVTDSTGASATTSHLIYVTAPPSGLASTDGTTNASCASTTSTAPTMASLTPTLSATVSSGLTAQFELRDITDPSITPPIVIGGQASSGSAGPNSTLTTPTLANGHEYAFAARSTDPTGDLSPVSTTCYFWALTSGTQATPTGAVGLPFDNTMYPAGTSQTWAGPVTTLTWANGNLALTRNSDTKTLWASGTSGSNNVLVPQFDGNLAIYSSQPTVNTTGTVAGTPIWSTGTAGQGATAMLLAVDGTLTVRNGTTVLWNAPLASHSWTLNDGQSLTAADSGFTGGSPATLDTVGVSWQNSNYVSFAGTTARIATTGPVLDTTKSFTVSAWANLAATGSVQTMVVQQATHNSAFYIEYNGTNWQFAMPTTDVPGASFTQVASSSPATAGTWTHLIGTYNATSGQMALYVNGVLSSTGTLPNPIASSGLLAMGRGYVSDVTNNRFKGSLADVRVYQQTVSDSQAASIYQSSSFAKPQVSGPAGTLISANTNSASPSQQYCLDDLNGSLANTTTVIDAYGCNGTWPQAWQFATDGTIRIMGTNPANPPNKCLDTGGINTQGSKVTLFDCQTGNGNQQWKIVPSSSAPGQISLQNPLTGMCLDNTNGAATNQNPFQLYQCLDNANQHFTAPTAPGQNQQVEAESVWNTTSGGTLAVQANCCGATWSNGAQQLFASTASGSSFTLNYYVANPGRYAITPVMSKATDFGILKLSVDGTALPTTFDAYNNGVITQQADFGGSVTLAAGMHAFTFTITGTNAASTGNRYDAGIDTLILQPTAR